MPPREKKNFSRSKKFDEISLDRKKKLAERSIQKKTGYERDARTLMKNILEQVKAAEEGTGEITREELVLVKLRLEKIITHLRVLQSNKGVRLTAILGKVISEKTLILDYITDKRKLAGKVTKHGEGGVKSATQSNQKSQSGRFETTDDEYEDGSDDEDIYSEFGGDGKKKSARKSSESFYKELGFDDVEEEEAGDFVITARQTTDNQRQTDDAVPQQEQSESFRRMCLNLIDDRMSALISRGIEHLMLTRKRRGKGEVNFRDVIISYFDDEIGFTKNETTEELRRKGYQPDQVLYFSDLYDKEFKMNETLMIRKCLYLSRVLEYRKGSTSTG